MDIHTNYSSSDLELEIKKLKYTLKKIRNTVDDMIMKIFAEKLNRIHSKDDNQEIKSEILSFSEEILQSRLSNIEVVNEMDTNEFLNSLEIKISSLMKEAFLGREVPLEKPIQFQNLTFEKEMNFKSSSGTVGFALVEISNENIFAIGTKQGDLLLYDSDNLELIQGINSAHNGWIISLSHVPEKNLIFSTSSDCSIGTFTIKNKRLSHLKYLKEHSDVVNTTLCVLSKNIFLSCGRDPDIKVWNLDTFNLISKIETNGEGKMGCQMVFLEQLNCVGVGFYTGKLNFYNVETCNCMKSITTGGDNYYINSLILLKQSYKIVAQIKMNVICIWDIQKDFQIFREIQTDGHANFILSDSKEEYLLTTCDKPYIELWKLNDINFSKKINLPSSMKNSNGILPLKACSKLIVTSWKNNIVAVFNSSSKS
jgi:WD40 repeat protein